MKKQSLSQNFVVVESMETEKINKKTLRNKIVIESQESVTGKDEMNLIELPFCLVSYRNSANIKTLAPEAEGLNIIRETQNTAPQTILSNSSGFGGANTALIFSKYGA